MKAALPPGPSEPRLAQMMQWISRPMTYATRQRDRYGDAFTANIDERPWVMLGDPADVRTVFTAGPQRTNAGEANEILRPTLGSHSLLLLDGQEHLRQRKLMLPAFHGERIERYRQIMRDATERTVASWPARRPFALRPHTQAITMEVIVRAVFGVDDAGAMARLREPLRRMLDWAGNPAPLLLVAMVGPDNPFIRRVIARRYTEPVDRELYALIAQRRRAPDLAERDDVLSTLLLARDEDGQPMTDVELRDELLTLLVAGHELPAGTTVAPCILLVHRREDIYPEPNAFRPERFLGRPPGTYTWIPFGGGVRRCLGAAFAQFEMQVVLETIARSARLEAVGRPEDVRRRGVTLVPSRGGEVRVA